jgi:hypothetical protein
MVDPCTVTVELDTRIQPLSALLTSATECFDIKDMTITGPDLEEITAGLYQSQLRDDHKLPL